MSQPDSLNREETLRWSKSIKKLWTGELDLPPACLEFVPEFTMDITAKHFVVGTYKLEDDEATSESSPTPQTRNGSLSLWRLDGDVPHMEDRITHPAGVFDLKFYSNTKYFAVAASNGSISMYRIKDNGHDRAQSIVHISTMQLFAPTTMVTSVAWQMKVCPQGVFPIIAVTTSTPDCGVYVFFVSYDFVTITQRPGVSDSVEPPTLHMIEPIKRHTDNVWTSTLGPDFTLYSGADDGTLKRSVLEHCPNSGMFQENKLLKPAEFVGHGAGVTSIMILPFPTGHNGDHLLLTGGYGDHVRIWSTTFLSSTTAKKLAELYIGGCAWRFKLMEDYPLQPTDENVTFRVLASCMQVGFKILELKGKWGEKWTITELAGAIEKKHLAYGCDVQPMKSPGEEKRIIVSTSFYLKSLSLWSWDPTVPSGHEEYILQGEGLSMLLELEL